MIYMIYNLFTFPVWCRMFFLIMLYDVADRVSGARSCRVVGCADPLFPRLHADWSETRLIIFRAATISHLHPPSPSSDLSTTATTPRPEPCDTNDQAGISGSLGIYQTYITCCKLYYYNISPRRISAAFSLGTSRLLSTIIHVYFFFSVLVFEAQT